MSKDVKTIPGRFYTVTLSGAGTVQAKRANGSLLLLASVASAGQVLVQAYTDLFVVSDDAAEITSVKAPISVGGVGVTDKAFTEHEDSLASPTQAGHVRVGGAGVTSENGQLRIHFRSEHSGFEVDGNNAVYANTGTNDHPAHGSIAPVATDSAGKFCVPALTTEKLALIEVLLSNKDNLLAAIGASVADAAAISEAAAAMAFAEAEAQAARGEQVVEGEIPSPAEPAIEPPGGDIPIPAGGDNQH